MNPINLTTHQALSVMTAISDQRNTISNLLKRMEKDGTDEQSLDVVRNEIKYLDEAYAAIKEAL